MLPSLLTVFFLAQGQGKFGILWNHGPDFTKQSCVGAFYLELPCMMDVKNEIHGCENVGGLQSVHELSG